MVERQIRAHDPNGRRKYLQRFRDAYPTYESVLSRQHLQQLVTSADVLLVGDYHALPQSQRYTAALLQELAEAGRPLVLGLETVLARDQHILDEWMRGEIDDEELRERIRFDLDWGYEWEPFRQLLESARRHALAVYGLDCVARHDLRKIAARDRHAAQKIAEARARHPQAVVVALFGESHLAPTHIPLGVRTRRPGDRILTVLQNMDQLFWQSVREPSERVEAVKVRDDVVCVFNSSPLEKYETYRLCLERWKQEGRGAVDLAPTFYNLIDSLLRFFNVTKYSSQNGRQPRFLVDMLPQVYFRHADEWLQKLLDRRKTEEARKRAILAGLEETGSCYVPALRAIFVRELKMVAAAEAAARFVHHALSGEPAPAGEAEPEDVFYGAALAEALGYFGSKVLCPERPAVREGELYALYACAREPVEKRNLYSYADFLKMVDFLVLHKDLEANLRQYHYLPDLIREGTRYNGQRFRFTTRRLGQMLGSELYDAYVNGRVSKRFLRSLFFRRLHTPGTARTLYFDVVRRLRRVRRKPPAA